MVDQHEQRITHDRRGWHWDKGISISTIIAIAAFFTPFIVWLSNLDKRIEMAQYTQAEYIRSQDRQAERDEQQRARDYSIIQEMRREIRESKK